MLNMFIQEKQTEEEHKEMVFFLFHSEVCRALQFASAIYKGK